jgi:hypothetical protein
MIRYLHFDTLHTTYFIMALLLILYFGNAHYTFLIIHIYISISSYINLYGFYLLAQQICVSISVRKMT